MMALLSNYDSEDISAVSLNVDSTSLWNISPPNLQRLKDNLIGNKTLKFRFSYSVSRATHEQKSDSVAASQVFSLKSDSLVRRKMIELIYYGNYSESIQLPFLFPKFLKVR